MKKKGKMKLKKGIVGIKSDSFLKNAKLADKKLGKAMHNKKAKC